MAASHRTRSSMRALFCASLRQSDANHRACSSQGTLLVEVISRRYCKRSLSSKHERSTLGLDVGSRSPSSYICSQCHADSLSSTITLQVSNKLKSGERYPRSTTTRPVVGSKSNIGPSPQMLANRKLFSAPVRSQSAGMASSISYGGRTDELRGEPPFFRL